MKRLRFLIPMLLFLLALPAAAQEPICPQMPVCPADAPCPPPPCGGGGAPLQDVHISSHHVTVTINNQIATTNVDLQFVNDGSMQAEGQFIFPLPGGAAVDNLTLYINGQPVEGKILPADQAQDIYNDIVRQYRDPALLQYIGTSAVQANVFPIPPGESRRVQISYSQALDVDNGLIHYVYPLKVTNLLSSDPVDSLSIQVSVQSNDPISSIYSPSHPIAVDRDDAHNAFTAGYEDSGMIPQDDFSLFYGIASQTINANLLTYRESSTEEGFFMLLVQPPMTIPDDQTIAKDVIVVLDQSGSMYGDKWDQARSAAEYVLKHLNPKDRFNVILFSTGERTYSNKMESPDQAQGAIDWMRGQDAEGGTDINGAMTTALDMADTERPTTVLFLTDGVATEGETDTQTILSNIKAASRPNVRVFTFGVGDDVDTLLLDSIVRDQHGASSYVRPTERIDEQVASLYNKISAPVLTDVTLDTGNLQVDDLYPAQPLPDLFAGSQLTLVGRYRGDASNLSFTISGKVNGQEQTFVYSGLNFPAHAGGEAFISRLWATRRIGDLLNDIRLNGENQELVSSIVDLSVRYGIITPYTSFLTTDNDILSQRGQADAEEALSAQAQTLSTVASGAGAVNAAADAAGYANANAPVPAQIAAAPVIAGTVGQGGGAISSTTEATNPIQTVGGKTFILRDSIWTDTTFQPDTMQTQKVEFLSDDYFALLAAHPELSQYFAVGDKVIAVLDGTAYEVTSTTTP